MVSGPLSFLFVIGFVEKYIDSFFIFCVISYDYMIKVDEDILS